MPGVPKQDLSYWIKKAKGMELLLGQMFGGILFHSCLYKYDPRADPCFHCCDFNEFAEKIAEVLEIDKPKDG